MEQFKRFTAESTDALWQQFANTIKDDGDLFSCKAVLDNAGKEVQLLIDIDLGGGFQSGISTTTFFGKLTKSTDFRFALHHQHFIDEVGKFFGMEDIVIGYKEFDESLIIKTNNASICKEIFADAATRMTLQQLDNFTFYTEQLEEEGRTGLFLMINEGVTDLTYLKELYVAFFNVLLKLELIQ